MTTICRNQYPTYVFSSLAGRIIVSSIHKTTPKTFSGWVAMYAERTTTLCSASSQTYHISRIR